MNDSPIVSESLPGEPDVRVVKATGEMIDRILEIENASFSCPWSRGSFADILQADNGSFLAALGPDGKVTGFAIMLVIEPEAEILNLAVDPGMRRHGIACLLMRTLLSEASSGGVECVYLEVRESNGAAIGLYRSLGFQQIGLRRQYYQCPAEDAILMKLDLKSE